jgi:hypothetical protein
MQEQLNESGSEHEEVPDQNVDPSSIGGQLVLEYPWLDRPKRKKVQVNRGSSHGVERGMYVDFDGKVFGIVHRVFAHNCLVRVDVPHDSMKIGVVLVEFSNTRPSGPAQATTIFEQNQESDHAIDESSTEGNTESATERDDREANDEFKKLVLALSIAASTDTHDDGYDFGEINTASEAILEFAKRRPENSDYAGAEADRLRTGFLFLWRHFQEGEISWKSPVETLGKAYSILWSKDREARHARENH